MVAWCQELVEQHLPRSTTPSLSSASLASSGLACEQGWHSCGGGGQVCPWRQLSPPGARHPACSGLPCCPRRGPTTLFHRHGGWHCQAVTAGCYMMTDHQGWTDTSEIEIRGQHRWISVNSLCLFNMISLIHLLIFSICIILDRVTVVLEPFIRCHSISGHY